MISPKQISRDTLPSTTLTQNENISSVKNYKRKFEEIKLRQGRPKKFTNYLKPKLQASTTPRKLRGLNQPEKDYGDYSIAKQKGRFAHLKTQKTEPIMEGEHKKSFNKDLNNSFSLSEKHYNFSKDIRSPEVVKPKLEHFESKEEPQKSFRIKVQNQQETLSKHNGMSLGDMKCLCRNKWINRWK